MELGRRPPMHRCNCYMESAEGVEFKKIVESEDIGVTIYRYVPQTRDAVQKRNTTDGEVFVLQNTKDAKVTSQDLATVFDQNVVSCPRCLTSIERAENFLKDVPLLDREDVMGVCDHCVRKQRPLSSTCKCQDIVDKFLLQDQEQRKKQIKLWLKRVQDQLQKTTLDTKQNNKLKSRTRSEISLNTAISKFSKSEHKHFVDGHPESQLGTSRRLKSHLPRSARAISSLDSLHDTEFYFKPKEFDNLFAPLKYPKRKYYDQTEIPLISQKQTANIGPASENVQSKQVELTNAVLPPTIRKLTQTIPECMLVDPQEYIKRAIRPDTADETKVFPELSRKDSLLDLPTKKEIKTIKGFFKLPEDKQVSNKVSIEKKIQPFDTDSLYKAAKEHKAEIKPKRTSILKSHEDEKTETQRQERSKMSSPTLAHKKHSKESFLKETSERDISRVFSFSFPKERGKKLRDRHVSSSELIKNTQDMLQKKAEEEKRKKEEELKRKREEEERNKLEREKKIQAAAVKIAKAEEEKRRKAEKEKRRKAEEEKSKETEGKLRRENEDQKQFEERKGLEDKKNKHLKEEKQEVLNKQPTKPKTTPISQQSSKQSDKDKNATPQKVKERNENKVSGDEKVKVTAEKKDKQEHVQKSKEDKQADQGRLEKDKGDKQKDVVEKDLTKAEHEGKQTKPDKEKRDENENKKTKPDKEKKGEPSRTIEPKAKNDKNDKLEGDTLKALLASQQKEKQEQEKMLKEQQKEDELARKKAAEAAKLSKSEDKNAKEEAANKLKKLKEMPETPEPPPPSKKKEEAPNTKELAIKEVKIRRPSTDDLMLQLVKIKKEENRDKKVNLSNVSPVVLNEHGKSHRNTKRGDCIICIDSDLALDFEELIQEKKASVDTVMNDVIIGEKIFKFKAPFKLPHDEPIVELKDIQQTEGLKPASPPTRPIKKNEMVDLEATKGVIRYALSDRTFIDKGWTMLPTEKVVRKMNVYRMSPAHPEFDWFEHNKYKRVMEYDCGAKLAEFDDNGRGRWYYRSGKLALDYYDAEELNAQQRFVVYSSGEPDERGRTRPRTILAAFDYLGNGVVFDHTGKIRLKYNQTEGVVLDRSIGPVSHWKWHTLNDPPVLQQVMIDTQMAFKDARIMKLGEKNQEKAKPDNEEMLAIEFDNFIKEKSRKLTQKFKPFQIKMKALKINEYFSLRVLDQATVYLLFRDGTTNLKINMGMILDHKEIVDTDTAEVGEVSNSLERMPARTDSIAALQQAVAQAQRQERSRVRHERRLRPTQPRASADELRTGVSQPLRAPLVVASTTGIQCDPQCPNRCRKPPSASASNLYYETRL